MSRDSTLMTHTSNTSFPLSSRLPLIPALYAVYHTHFRMRPHAIVQLFPTPRQAWRSQCVSSRDVIKHDRLSRWIFNILARCAHQGRPNAVTASCTCKGHLVYLLGDVTSPWRKQEIVETTWQSLAWHWTWSREQSWRKKQEEVIKKGKFVYSACFLQT